jgi:catechol 2,3-dioxygenase-like lactoylglutathione lyase family enzyme
LVHGKILSAIAERNQSMSNGMHGIHHIGMRSENLDRSLDFYVRGLGLPIVLEFEWDEGGRAVILDLGNHNFLEIGNDGAPEPVGRITHFALAVDNCQAAFEKAVAAGGIPKGEPHYSNVIQAKPAPWELISVYVIGPDGEEIEFIETVSAPF